MLQAAGLRMFAGSCNTGYLHLLQGARGAPLSGAIVNVLCVWEGLANKGLTAAESATWIPFTTLYSH